MSVLSKEVDESGQFDEEVKALTIKDQLEPSELRVLVEDVCVHWDRFAKIFGLVFRQSGLVLELALELDARRRRSLTRRLKRVNAELERMK